MADYRKLRKEGKLFGTIKRAKSLFAERANLTSQDLLSPMNSTRKMSLRRRCFSEIPLGNNTIDEVNYLVFDLHPRRKNWEAPVGDNTFNPPHCAEINNGQYSSGCSYTHWIYRPTVGCFATILPRRKTLRFVYAGDTTVLTAPRGYVWRKDQNGILLISSCGKKDYHPDSDDLRNYKKSVIRNKAITNYKTRLAVKRAATTDKKAIAKAQAEGAMICIADSVRAGNCHTGTLSFARRHNLNTSRHYTPTHLLKIANGDAHRVRLSVAVGLRRHRQEMSAGCCIIADHIV